MKLTMLGTGHAVVTGYYNTCFVLEDEGQYFLVDGGGGGFLLNRLDEAGIPWYEIHDVFVTHKHTDHILGIIWMIRLWLAALSHGKAKGELNIYGNEVVIEALRLFTQVIFTEKENEFVDHGLNFVLVQDGDEHEIIGHTVRFFDIRASKILQFGIVVDLGEGRRLVCNGDETFNDECAPIAEGATWFMHEAFCLYSQADVFKPYEKGHSTAKDAAQIAEGLGVDNLILYHTEDSNVGTRKELYTTEASQFFTGNVYVPEDLETIEL